MLIFTEAYTTSAAADPFEDPMPEHHELKKYGLTIDQYQNWKKNNPDSFLRNTGRFFSTMVPGAIGILPGIFLRSSSGASAGSGGLGTIMARWGMNKFNNHFIDKDLIAAQQYYKNGGR